LPEPTELGFIFCNYYFKLFQNKKFIGVGMEKSLETMKKRCPTLQQIRIDKLKKEKKELKRSVFNWKVRFFLALILLIIKYIIQIHE
jgi:hypothetical protein